MMMSTSVSVCKYFVVFVYLLLQFNVWNKFKLSVVANAMTNNKQMIVPEMATTVIIIVVIVIIICAECDNRMWNDVNRLSSKWWEGKKITNVLYRTHSFTVKHTHRHTANNNERRVIWFNSISISFSLQHRRVVAAFT